MSNKFTRKVSSLKFPLAAPTWPDSLPRPNPKRNTGLDYDTAWARRYPARFARAVFVDFISSPLVKTMAPTSVTGAEALSRIKGPVIFAANHNSHVDTAVLLSAIPVHLRHKVVVAAASDFFFDSTVKATAMSLVLGAIPIERSKVNRRSAETALELLKEGWSVIIYPEGGRSPDGWMHDFKGGAAYLSVRSDAPVVPVFLDGTSRVLPKSPVESGVSPGGSGSESRSTSRLRRHPVSVTFGRALRSLPDEDARKMGPRIEAAVSELGREVATDYWTARRHRDTSTTHGPSAAPWRRSWARPPAIKVSERTPRDSWPE
jgi:1-acyl-sn-glycerol-3-phosphate acyltransferase